MKIPKLFIVCLTALFIAGCSVTSKDLRSGPENSFTFDVPENYQAAYRKILKQERACHGTNYWLLDGSYDVEQELYQDIRKGSITVIHRAGANSWVIHEIEVDAIDDQTSKVTMFVSKKVLEWNRRRLTQWVLKNLNSCEPI